MVRVPGPGRFELRLPDGATNPYLLQAVIIAAGLSGIRSKADPGKRLDIDMYAEGHTVKDAPRLPLNMLDAMREYDKDTELKSMMGDVTASRFSDHNTMTCAIGVSSVADRARRSSIMRFRGSLCTEYTTAGASWLGLCDLAW